MILTNHKPSASARPGAQALGQRDEATNMKSIELLDQLFPAQVSLA